MTLQDLRYALRILRLNPGFTAIVILTLALGIGMNTAVFSVVNAVLLRSISYPDADRLIWIARYSPHYESWRDSYISRADYVLWRAQAQSFESMTAYGNQDLSVLAGDQSTQERIASTTGDFWSMTGARPAIGRLFAQGETNTMVLTHALFEKRFGGDPRTVGRIISINGHPFTIVGVLTQDFRFHFPQQYASGDEVRDIDAYIPIPDAAEAPGATITQTRGPAPFWVRVVGKARPGVSLDQAITEIQTVYTRIAREYPNPSGYPLRSRQALRAGSLNEKLVREARPALLVLLIAVGFVLLIACTNIANLLLARASTRQREIAIRTALGAGRLRLMRQFLAESVLLALLGGAAGLILARAGLALMIRLAPQAVPRLQEATIDASVLLFTAAVSLLTGLLFGLGPAISLWESDPHERLKENARTSTAGAGRVRVRSFLVAAELALAVVLLSGAGLMLKSFWRMSSYPPGFEPEKTLVMRISLSGPQYNEFQLKYAYMQELLRRVGTTPGVESAGIDLATLNTRVRVERATSENDGMAAVRAVSPGYLKAIGVPLLKGRWPNESNLFEVVVNEAFARTIAGTEDPTGRRVSGSFFNDTIVGVVADFKHLQLDAAIRPELYMPYPRAPISRSMRVVIRTSGDAAAAMSSIRKLVSDIDRTQPVYEFQTLAQSLSDSIAPRRFNLFLLLIFAATAMAMAVIGIYGVIAYSVAQRTHEIGIRIALGARRLEIVGMVVRHGMTMTFAGIVMGVIAAIALTRLMETLLYDVTPNDPPVYAAAAAILVVTALIACWGPAARAAAVDPVIALRQE